MDGERPKSQASIWGELSSLLEDILITDAVTINWYGTAPALADGRSENTVK